MKRICAGASLLLVLAVPAPAHSENGYKLTSTTLDGGGGESRSPDDRFRLIGTIGQPDAGKLEGGPFRLNGGFWVCQSSSRPEPEPLAQKDGGEGPTSYKNRFISVTTSAADARRGQAIRVRFVNLPPSFDIWNGMDFFVGEPREVCENSGKGLETDPEDCPPGLPTDTFWAARLECEKGQAHYMDWHGWCDKGSCVGGLNPTTPCAVDDDCVEYVHLYHEGIVPSKMLTASGPIDIPAVYHVQVLDYTCPDADIYYSSPLVMQQAGWGDVCGPGAGGACKGVADGIVDVANDVLGVLDKFANLNNLQKARADLEPGDDGSNNGPDFKVNVANDVLYCLAAFGGAPYPFEPGNLCAPDLASRPSEATISGTSSVEARQGADLSGDERLVGANAVITVVPSQTTLQPGQAVTIETFVMDGISTLQAYQVALKINAGASGDLTIEDLGMDTERDDYVFHSLEKLDAVDRSTGRMGALLMRGETDVIEEGYLGTFTLRASLDSSGMFSVNIRTRDTSLVSAVGNKSIPFDVGRDVMITVGKPTNIDQPIRRGVH